MVGICSIKYKGFTLSEVLVTLGIIGIIAAVTIPTVIQKKENRELEVQFRKSYSLLIQTVQSVFLEEFYGRIDFSDSDLNQFTRSISKRYQNASNKWPVSEEFPNRTGGDRMNFMIATYRTYNSNTVAGKCNDAIVSILDGSTVFFDVGGGINGVHVCLDVNGLKNKPNKFGHDFFMFYLTQKGKLVPMGGAESHYNEEEHCSQTSKTKYNGLGCTVRAISDGKYFSRLK